MTFYTYILQSEKDDSFYIGQTNNLNDRLKRHNSGAEKYTRRKTPWKLYWHAEVTSRSEAMALEKRLKNLKSTKRMTEFIEAYQVGPAAQPRGCSA